MNNSTQQIVRYKELLFAHPKSAWLWLVVRIYLGQIWFFAGYEKLMNPDGVWVGEKAGAAISGFVNGALGKTAEGLILAGKNAAHPDVTVWYGWFLENCVATAPVLWSYLITYGEIAAGLGIIFGVLTTVAVSGGLLMNFSFLLAGTVSINPVMVLFGLPLLAAYRVSGRFGVGRYVREYWEKRKAGGGGTVASA